MYGEDPLASKNQAVNLLALFDEVILPPADEYLPEHIQYQTGDVYYHPELGVRVGGDWEFSREANRIAEKLLRETNISHSVAWNYDLPKDRKFFLGRLIEQLRLATKHGAVIVGGRMVSQLAAEVWRLVQSEITEIYSPQPSPDFLAFGDAAFNVTALTWECTDVESLKAIRTSSEVRAYAKGFRQALFAAADSADMNESMRRLMREAMESEDVARKAKGAFETTGVVSTCVGAVPVLGTPAALIGLGSFLVYKEAERAEQKHQWYLLGTKMREVSLRRILEQPDVSPKNA